MFERMTWLWRDHKRITHRMSKQLDKPSYVTQVTYTTWCGTQVTVDNVNPATKVARGTPTCIKCACAKEPE